MSEAYRVFYAETALNDLREIYAYIAFSLQAPQAAKDEINRLMGAARSLDILPSRHELVGWEPWKSMGMHKFPVDNFVIFYTVHEAEMKVDINRIFYGGRDIEGACQGK